ncbi:hypothetical protein QBC40DRAFT_286566 [Triangularia verruculosa]|uniref:Uncharacterized protein n=1 Tax=Triangularia verruculosa TaxID=2587418 RepID=A0AAN7ASF6_9PEZI|nr:hypothetical protein QBC40DRAFT_286566 [Triangularia verruculosa]
MAAADSGKRSFESGESDQTSIFPPPSAAFTGYRPFPAVMNLHSNFSGVVNALKSLKLCGATEDDFLYLVEAHYGFTPRGPLNFGPGYYLRNGTSLKSPILAATGDEYPMPPFIQLFRPKTAVKLPPLDQEKNPRDMVTEVVRSTKSKEHGVAFGFEIEVGVKRMMREAFEWRKVGGASSSSSSNNSGQAQGHADTGTRYTLYRLAPGHASRPLSQAGPSRSTSSAALPPVDETKVQIVADVVFGNVLNWKHPFTLELKGDGLTGELGERWALMVVMTTLCLCFLRQGGKTNKTTVGAAQKLHSK